MSCLSTLTAVLASSTVSARYASARTCRTGLFSHHARTASATTASQATMLRYLPPRCSKVSVTNALFSAQSPGFNMKLVMPVISTKLIHAAMA